MRSVGALPAFFGDRRLLKSQLTGELTKDWPIGKWYPCLLDRYSSSGTTSGDYFFQDLTVAQRIFAANPKKHVDVGSRIDGFVAHVASFRQVEVIDIRPQDGKVPNMGFRVADIMDEAASPADYTDSLSCLHCIEHFGLGRYGDPIDASGYLKAIRSFHKMLQPGGTFYLGTPIGPQRIEFNGQRVFGVDFLVRVLEEFFEIQRVSYINDAGHLHENILNWRELAPTHFGCRTGCGVFEMTKRKPAGA
jgi:SAM-dependent methyltransferase